MCQGLNQSLLELLAKLEEDGDIAITTTVPSQIVEKIRERITGQMPDPPLTSSEYGNIRSLNHEATSDKRFFDWEMPTFTGLTAAQFKQLAEKLPRD